MSSDVLLLTTEREPATVLPSLELLPHRVQLAAPDPAAVLFQCSSNTGSSNTGSSAPGSPDVVLVDARDDLARARDLCRLLSTGPAPVAVVVREGGLVTVNAEWKVDELVLPGIGPAELDARLRLLTSRQSEDTGGGPLTMGDLSIEEATYTVRVRGRALELTYKEFELLKYLAQHAGRVFTRAQLLQEVWGYDFFGGTRTVDVHIRRLRAKLGPEHDGMIGTVRGVGYKFVTPARSGPRPVKRPAAEAAMAAVAR